MNEKLKNILMSLIAGDATGYVFEGMKKAHIKNIFKSNDPFPDPEPALKNNMHKWKKPGLYSSITQFAFLSGAASEKRSWGKAAFVKMASNTPELPGLNFSFFRNPDRCEGHFISVSGNRSSEISTPMIPSSRIALSAIPLLTVKCSDDDLFKSLLDYSMLFTSDPGSIAAALALPFILKTIVNSSDSSGITPSAINALDRTCGIAEKNRKYIFESGMNPSYLEEKLCFFNKAISSTADIESIEQCEKMICEKISLITGKTTARGSLNFPESLFPFAVSIAARCSEPEGVFFTASREGGSSSALTSTAAVLSASLHGNIVPDEILAGIVNRKKAEAIIDIITSDKDRSVIFNEIILSEPPLTLKELEEFNARNRKNPDKKPQKKQKTRKEAESEITRHIVESWTKIDKARWKKERNKLKT